MVVVSALFIELLLLLLAVVGSYLSVNKLIISNNDYNFYLSAFKNLSYQASGSYLGGDIFIIIIIIIWQRISIYNKIDLPSYIYAKTNDVSCNQLFFLFSFLNIDKFNVCTLKIYSIYQIVLLLKNSQTILE